MTEQYFQNNEGEILTKTKKKKKNISRSTKIVGIAVVIMLIMLFIPNFVRNFQKEATTTNCTIYTKQSTKQYHNNRATLATVSVRVARTHVRFLNVQSN